MAYSFLRPNNSTKGPCGFMYSNGMATSLNLLQNMSMDNNFFEDVLTWVFLLMIQKMTIHYFRLFNSPKAFGEFKTLLSPPSPPPSPHHSNFYSFFLFFLPLFSHLHNFAMTSIDSTWPKLALTCPNLPKLAQTWLGSVWLWWFP